MVHKIVAEDEGRALLEMLDHLKQGAQASTGLTVRVLAAADHDGVCAATIIDTVLRREEVKLIVHPVTGNADIQEQVRNLKEEEEVRSLILLNCGAGLNLHQWLEDAGAHPDLRCFVIDAHRPLLLENLYPRSTRVVVIDDDRIAEASGMRPPLDEDEVESDEEAADEDEEGAGDSEERERKRRRRLSRDDKLAERRDRVNEYYSSSYYATPAAVSLFKMARLDAVSGAPSQELLWVAAIASMGYLDLGLVSKTEYEHLAWDELKESLDGMEYSTMNSQSDGGSLPDAEGDEDSGGRRPAPRGGLARRKLRFEPDLRLTLYKHWTLEESIMHSSYFYGTLELNRDKGLRSLKNLFATAGIPPKDYKQLYSCMKIPVQQSLHQKFRDHGRSYGLAENNMFLQQFVRDLGPLGEGNPALFLHQLSCCDAVHVITALLSSVPHFLSGVKTEHLPQAANGQRDLAAVHEMEREALVSNFWRAFDTVKCSDAKGLRDGISEAVETVKAVQSLGRLIKDQKSMHNSRFFRWCKVEQPPPIFRHHLAVRRLAVWLLQVLFAYRPKGEGPERPLLVIVRDHVRNTYLCVGASPPRLAEQDDFGNRFRRVLRTDSTLSYRYDFFDKSCIEISAEDFDRFWEILVDSPE